MAISKKRKEELVAQYSGLIGQSEAMFMADYTGLNVKAMEELRTAVAEANGAIHVTKNTLLELALKEADKPVSSEFFAGQMATSFALDGAPTLAKALVDYAKKNDSFELKGGLLGADQLSVAEIEALADLPTLPQLQAQILGLISGPARNIASTLASGVRQLVNVVDAYAKKEDEE